ncbi:MAG: porin [Ruegeria sp.]|uniref:porin n=1 Tax=Ruegeria sp. TaxID=1879320 RepID=UPI00349EC6DE
MKKVLFATTALMATATVASADIANIRMSGYGRFGLGYVEDRDALTGNPDVSDTILVHRFRLNIDAVAESDGGVEFSGRVRLQADEDADTGEANAAGLNGARFTVAYGGLRVDVGNVAGAFDNLANYYGNEPGLENFIGQYSAVDYDFLAYSSGGAGSNGVFFNYAVGDFGFAASYDENSAPIDADNRGDRWDLSATYSFNNITAAIAYGENDANEELLVLTLGGDWGPFSGTLFVGDETVTDATGTTEDAGRSDTFYGVSAAYEVGAATTVTFAYGDGSGDADERHVGLGFIHDLGGGTSLRGGIGSIDPGTAGDDYLRADFGARFDF